MMDSKPTTAYDLLRRTLATCAATHNATTAATTATEGNAQELVVVDTAGYALGIITRFELLIACQSGAASTAVGELLSSTLVTCMPDTPIHEVVRLMLRSGAALVLVATSEPAGLRPVGVLSTGDIVRYAVGRGRSQIADCRL